MSTWVFLRGLTRERRHWGDLPERFRRKNADTQVISLDLPGNGSLHELNSPWSVEAMANFCRAELARRAVVPPYHVLAMSLGAMVAVAWANKHTKEIRSCVLINTSMRPFNPFYERLRPANYPILLKLALIGGTPEQWEKTILRLTSRQAESPAIVLNNWTAYRREHPVSRANALRQLIAAARYRAPLDKPATRILLLASAQDALVNPRCSHTIASRWNADIALHPTAGHDIPLDDPSWVIQQISAWRKN
jgi:pimeloyl-ACP methyl ester carboxylesterase